MSILQEGQMIRGIYEVERLLGEGAFAEVYRVRHRFLERQAMKVLKVAGISDEEIAQMLSEALLLTRLDHPNIIRVFDAGVLETPHGSCGFFTMEYVAGGSLEHFWRSHGTRLVPVETAVELTRQVCRGLAVAHSQNPPIIHRDVKPQNILVGYAAEGLRVRVADFGLAKRVNPLTLLASSRGTRCFKAPESFRDFQSDSCAGDVWAVGSTLYLLLTDRLPFVELNELETLDGEVFKRPMIPASRLNLQVDPMLDQILFRALALKPGERHPTAREFLADLEKWKPRAASATGPASSSSADMTKSALGQHSPVDEKSARQLAAKAVTLASQARKWQELMEAADLMEEALNKWPDLREKHEYQIRLWRRGVTM